MQIISLVVLMGLVYALLILPQQRRMRRHQQLVSGVVVGDEVLTSSGIYGTIVEIDPDEANVLRVEIAEGVVVSLDRSAVSEVAVEIEAADEAETAESADEAIEAAPDDSAGDSAGDGA